MVKAQRKLLFGIVAVTAAFLPLDLIFGADQTLGLVLSRVLLFGGYGGVALVLPRLEARARTVALTALGVISPIAVALMCWGTGGTVSPAFSFMWALPMLVGMVCLEEPTADLAATLLTAVCGGALMVSEHRPIAQLVYFLMVTFTGGALGTTATWIRRRNHRAELSRARESEAQLSRMIEAMPAAVYVADTSVKPWYSNAPAKALLGESGPVPGFIAGTDQPYPTEKLCMTRALKGERAQIDDIEIDSPTGRRCLEVRGGPLRGSDGQITHGIVMLHDITERRRAEQALKEAQHRLSQADRISSLGTLAAGVAHEINNPLAFISNNVEYVKEQLGARDDPAVAELLMALKEAQQGIARVRDTVRDLQLFSSSHPDRISRVDPARCLEAALSLAGNEIRHRARLEKELSAVPSVMGHESGLVQVFMNLLTNAAQAMPEGRADENTLTVRTRIDERGRIVVEVSDTGSGIPAHVLPRIFEPFFTTKAQGVGTGLGLSICHGIVKKLGGELEVETKDGVGSTFRVRLPAAPPQVPVAAPPAAIAGAGPGADGTPREVIAVIDDDALIGASVKRMLSRDYDVRLFTEAGDALQWLDSDPRCDAILCDLMMPRMTGMDFHEELARRKPRLAGRVVFATGGAFTDRSRQFLESARYSMEKPFLPHALQQMLQRVLADTPGGD